MIRRENRFCAIEACICNKSTTRTFSSYDNVNAAPIAAKKTNMYKFHFRTSSWCQEVDHRSNKYSSWTMQVGLQEGVTHYAPGAHWDEHETLPSWLVEEQMCLADFSTIQFPITWITHHHFSFIHGLVPSMRSKPMTLYIYNVVRQLGFPTKCRKYTWTVMSEPQMIVMALDTHEALKQQNTQCEFPPRKEETCSWQANSRLCYETKVELHMNQLVPEVFFSVFLSFSKWGFYGLTRNNPTESKLQILLAGCHRSVDAYTVVRRFPHPTKLSRTIIQKLI